MKATSPQRVKLSKQPGCQGHVSLKGNPGVDLRGPLVLLVLLLAKLLLVLLVSDWIVLTGLLSFFNPLQSRHRWRSPCRSQQRSAFCAIWRSGWRRHRGMIYSALTFSPEGLHNSSYFRGSVAAHSDIQSCARRPGKARQEVCVCVCVYVCTCS